MTPWNLPKTPWIALLLSMLATLVLFGDGPAQADHTFERHGDNLKYWFDATGQSDFAAAQNQDFQTIPKSSLGFGFTRGTLWVRLELPPHQDLYAQPHWIEFDSALLSHWQVFVPGRDQPVYEAGLSVPRSPSDHTRSPAFRITLDPGRPGLWYFRIRSDHAMNLNPEIHTQKTLEAKEKREAYFLGAYAGVMVFTYMLTLYIFIRTRHLNFLYYSLLLLFFHLVYQFTYNQMAGLYLWPQSPWWSNRAAILLGELTHIFGALFVRDTLQTQNHSPRLDLVIRLVPLRALFFISWAIFDMSPEVMKYSVLASMLCIFFYYGLGLKIWARGYAPARYFSIAWLPVLIGNALVFIQDLNLWVAPSPEWQETIRFEFPILGAAIQAILLGVAVGDQFRRTQREQREEQEAREKLEQSLDDAHTVQEAFIRSDSVNPLFEIRSSHQMSAKIGGDWLGYAYDAPRRRLVLAISDVTGHGLPSALLTGALHGAFYGLTAAEPVQSLSDAELVRVLMDRLDHVVRTTAQNTGLMATMALVCINLETYRIEYRNAGHTPVLISSRQGQHFMLKGGSPLGISDEPDFGHDSWQATAGDVIFLFTDGLLDQAENGQRNHLKAIAEHIRPEFSMDRIHGDIGQMMQRNQLTLEDDSSYLLCRLLAA
ncbi:MAG TPA: 7TM diverse intracellular signaling domain-containing protein [Oligoflexus sp.]|uniref:7TM diverse intracellular signaling domain-containing protein n=1 Tax=Oligoflexus sp. TaxID=1971216 RepID=UPI002D7FD834|nr:7TM diverse intracellular signaling domain-containing protein [Oligoflexus sp.]HET9241317.1 7TM diverse intracellular signaling domain-containing protein [Oligoflexus sp.]